MSAARRFVIAPSTTPDSADFGRDALVETWRALVPQEALVVGGRGLRARLGLLGKETLELVGARESPDDRVSAGGLAVLWHRTHDAPRTAGPAAIVVTTSADCETSAEDLAAAVTAVAGELGLDSVRIVQLAERDAVATKQLVRAFRRMTDVLLSTVVHTGSVAETVAAFASGTVFVSHDDVAATIASSMLVPTVRPDAHRDLTELCHAVRTATPDVTAADTLRRARAEAFALDAWARGRMTTEDLRSTLAEPSRVDHLVGA